MNNLKFITVVLALLFTASKAQAQFFQTEPNHRLEAAFRAIDRPNKQTNTPGLFNGNTGKSVLRFDDATDLNFGLGVDLGYVFKTANECQYEIRGFFTSWDTQSSRTGSNLTIPLIGVSGISLNQFDISNQAEMYNLELNRRHDILSGLTCLVGVRYMALNEQIVAAGSGTFTNPFGTTGFNGSTSTETRNPMIGLQLGGEGRVYLLQGVHLDLDTKAALFSNSARQTTIASSNLTSATVREGSNNDANWMLEYSLRLHYDLILNKCSLFVGYEGMYLSGVAVATRQIIPSNILIDDNENLTFNGISFGMALKR